MRGYREGGIQFFFKGLAPTLYRGWVANAACLTAFDYLMMQHKKQQKNKVD